MYSALKEAEIAFEENEVPIGAVVVHNNKIIGKGRNRVQQLKDPTAHAEILAITAAANYLKSKYLTDCDLYVTVEPCLMCSGAILLSHLKTVYYSIEEPKLGACGSVYNVIEKNKYNHAIKIYGGIYAEESKNLMKSFFLKKRIGKN